MFIIGLICYIIVSIIGGVYYCSVFKMACLLKGMTTIDISIIGVGGSIIGNGY